MNGLGATGTAPVEGYEPSQTELETRESQRQAERRTRMFERPPAADSGTVVRFPGNPVDNQAIIKANGHFTPGLAEAYERLQAEEVAAAEQRDAVIILDRPTATARYLDLSVDIEALSIPLAQFPGLYKVLPTCEITCCGWSAFINEIAPNPAPIFRQKSDVPYVIAAALQEAELSEKAQEQLLRKTGQSATVGKARSNEHLKSLGPSFLLDDDGDALARVPGLAALGCAACVYTSYSYGSIKKGATEPSKGGRTPRRSGARLRHRLMTAGWWWMWLIRWRLLSR